MLPADVVRIPPMFPAKVELASIKVRKDAQIGDFKLFMIFSW
jgi:hypothetical protein